MDAAMAQGRYFKGHVEGYSRPLGCAVRLAAMNPAVDVRLVSL